MLALKSSATDLLGARFRIAHLLEDAALAEVADETQAVSPLGLDNLQSNLITVAEGPAFTALSITPAPATAGDQITITFTCTQDLAAPPAVTLNGENATLLSQDGRTYQYSYTLSESDLEGPVTLGITGANAEGNTGATTTIKDLTKTPPPAVHDGDFEDPQYEIDLSEILRFVQFFNSDGYHCAQAGDPTDEGYRPGPGDQESCRPHVGDFNHGGPGLAYRPHRAASLYPAF